MALYFTDISLLFWTVTVTSTTSYPSKISVKLDLKVGKINATWLRIDWRKFTEFELQFIDGVQLRYKEPHAQVANTTIISFCNVYKTFEKIGFRRYPPMKLVCQFCNEILKLLEGKETKHTCLPYWKLWDFNHLTFLTDLQEAFLWSSIKMELNPMLIPESTELYYIMMILICLKYICCNFD